MLNLVPDVRYTHLYPYCTYPLLKVLERVCRQIGTEVRSAVSQRIRKATFSHFSTPSWRPVHPWHNQIGGMICGVAPIGANQLLILKMPLSQKKNASLYIGSKVPVPLEGISYTKKGLLSLTSTIDALGKRRFAISTDKEFCILGEDLTVEHKIHMQGVQDCLIGPYSAQNEPSYSCVGYDNKLYMGTLTTPLIMLAEEIGSIYYHCWHKHTLFAATERGVFSWENGALQQLYSFPEHNLSATVEIPEEHSTLFAIYDDGELESGRYVLLVFEKEGGEYRCVYNQAFSWPEDMASIRSTEHRAASRMDISAHPAGQLAIITILSISADRYARSLCIAKPDSNWELQWEHKHMPTSKIYFSEDGERVFMNTLTCEEDEWGSKPFLL